MTDELPWAHPMGWRFAFLCGIAYGLVVGGLTYAVWTVITQSVPGKTGDAAAVFAFATCLSVVLLAEADERSRIRKGRARDIRKGWR